MRRPERIIVAFRPAGETREAAPLSQRPDAVAPPGQDLVRIGLMADVPDQAVGGRVEDMVQGDRQFDDAETRAEMAAMTARVPSRLLRTITPGSRAQMR